MGQGAESSSIQNILKSAALCSTVVLQQRLECFRPFSSSPSSPALSAFFLCSRHFLPLSLHLSALPPRPPLEAMQPVCRKLLIHHFLQWQWRIKRPYLERNTWGLPPSSVLRRHFFKDLLLILLINLRNFCMRKPKRVSTANLQLLICHFLIVLAFVCSLE